MQWLPGAVVFGALSACFLAAKIQGQAFVSPRDFRSTYAPSEFSFPLNGGDMTYMQVHTDLNGVTGSVHSLAFRAESAPVPVRPMTCVVDLTLSTSPADSLSASPRFSANHGSDRTQVLASTTVSFPGRDSVSPSDFSHVIAFQSPFPFAGTGSLAWEVSVHTLSGQQTFLDRASSESRATWFGDSPLIQTSTFDRCGDPSGLWQFRVFGAGYPSGAPFLWLLGYSDQSYFGVPLPISLDPIAPGQELLVAPSAVAPGVSDPLGLVRCGFGVPKLSAVRSVPIFTQVAVLDPVRGLQMSVANRVVGPQEIGVVSIWSEGSLAATSGLVRSDAGVVTRFGF